MFCSLVIKEKNIARSLSLMESYKLLMIYETSCPRRDLHLYFHYLNVMSDNLFVYII